jgi:acetyltransferase-like isoleucine patch superfamily enzyme
MSILGKIFNRKQNKKIVITKRLDFYKLKNNNLLLGDYPTLKKSKIKIFGNNNILFCEKGVILEKTNITFAGNNSLIFLKRGKYNLEILINNDSVLHIGEGNYFNTTQVASKMILSEGKNIFIGNSCEFSLGLFFRNADPHLIYDKTTHNRINYSKSIYIGDHVWAGQNTIFLKGSQIHSGSIIGAGSVIANKKVLSNEVWAGNPIKRIKDNIFWSHESVHKWTSAETKERTSCNDDCYIYKKEDNSIAFDEIEKALNCLSTAKEKCEYLKQLPNFKNRFSA